jgi:nucleotide-binding universal stress UspA family protein
MFHKLLLPVDLANRHQPALDIAREIAGPNGHVVLLHVIEMIPGLSMEEEKPFYDRLQMKARVHLEHLAQTLAAHHMACATEIRLGNRVAEIVGYAREAGIDLIVLIAPPFALEDPATGWGSLSYKVSVFSTCPVLLVK